MGVTSFAAGVELAGGVASLWEALYALVDSIADLRALLPKRVRCPNPFRYHCATRRRS